MAKRELQSTPTNPQWIERYAKRLNGSFGDLSELSSDERKHLRILLRQYEVEQQLATLADTLSQTEFPLDETRAKSPVS